MADKDKSLVDIITGILFLIFCGYFYYQNTKLPHDSALFPGIILWSLAVCSLYLIGSAVKKRYDNKEEREIKSNKEERKSLYNKDKLRVEFFPIVFYLLVVLFIVFLPIIGFEYASFIFVLVGMWFINKRQLKRYFYIPILVPAVLTLLFRIILNVTLPTSYLPF